jgi:hypothetical protein
LTTERELVQSIRAYVNRHPALTVLRAEEAERLRLAVAQSFELPAARCWWWECIPASHAFVDYPSGDVSAWRDRMQEMLSADDQPLWLFVTDDELPPWICVTGSRDSLIEMLMELPYVEYFIVNQQLSRILFDTHHNRLIAHERVAHPEK